MALSHNTYVKSASPIKNISKCKQASFLRILQLPLTESSISKLYHGFLVDSFLHLCTLHVMLLGNSCPNPRAFSHFFSFSYSFLLIAFHYLTVQLFIYFIFCISRILASNVENPVLIDVNTSGILCHEFPLEK